MRRGCCAASTAVVRTARVFECSRARGFIDHKSAHVHVSHQRAEIRAAAAAADSHGSRRAPAFYGSSGGGRRGRSKRKWTIATAGTTTRPLYYNCVLRRPVFTRTIRRRIRLRLDCALSRQWLTRGQACQAFLERRELVICRRRGRITAYRHICHCFIAIDQRSNCL